jgi:hypothetical protein
VDSWPQVVELEQFGVKSMETKLSWFFSLPL